MTALTFAAGGTVPTTVDGLSKLLIWLTLEMAKIQPKYQILVDNALPAVNVSDYRIQSTQSHGRRMSVFWTLPMPTNWASTASKFFLKPDGLPYSASEPLTATETITIAAGSTPPAGITKLIQLAFWAADLLDSTVGNIQTQDYDPIIVNGQVISGGLIPLKSLIIGEDVNGSKYLFFRASIPLETATNATSLELFKQGKEVNAVTVPDRFLTV